MRVRDWRLEISVEAYPLVAALAKSMKQRGGDYAAWDCNQSSFFRWGGLAVVALKTMQDLGWKGPDGIFVKEAEKETA